MLQNSDGCTTGIWTQISPIFTKVSHISEGIHIHIARFGTTSIIELTKKSSNKKWPKLLLQKSELARGSNPPALAFHKKYVSTASRGFCSTPSSNSRLNCKLSYLSRSPKPWNSRFGRRVFWGCRAAVPKESEDFLLYIFFGGPKKDSQDGLCFCFVGRFSGKRSLKSTTDLYKDSFAFWKLHQTHRYLDFPKGGKWFLINSTSLRVFLDGTPKC